MPTPSSLQLTFSLHRIVTDLWYHEGEGFLRKILLSPLWVLSLLYRCAAVLRVFLYRKGLLTSRALPCRILCVGNITVGGTGKTPFVMAIARLLTEEGLRVGIVSRGYARRTRGSAVVSNRKEILLRPEEAGDEPYLMAQKLPGVSVAVGEDRYDAGRHLLDKGSDGPLDVILLDDGFSHLSLRRDMDILMFKGRAGLGNGHLLPRGPLREPLRNARRASAFVILGDNNALKTRLHTCHPGARVFGCGYRLTRLRSPRDGRLLTPADVSSSNVLAFCGIADASSFFFLIRDLDLHTVKELAYPDHYWYTDEDLVNIAAIAKKTGAEYVMTTEKDYVRIAHIPSSEGLSLLVAECELVIDEGFRDFVLSAMRR